MLLGDTYPALLCLGGHETPGRNATAGRDLSQGCAEEGRHGGGRVEGVVQRERKADGVMPSGTGAARKYGVCERLAIGKGATSVVRLAHKWDRTEEKLYAVKVEHFFFEK